MKILAKQNRELIMINAQNTQNENDAEKIILKVPEQYEDFNKKIVFVTPAGNVWDIITNNEYLIPKAITKYKQVDFYIWLTQGNVDFRTQTKTLKFYHNVDASEEITPEEISGVNTVVNLLEEEITKVENKETELNGIITDLQHKLDTGYFNGTNGSDGEDGESAYQIWIEQGNQGTEQDFLNSLKGHDGTNGVNGTNGQDGFSPVATVQETATGATISITDKNGTTSAEIRNGQDGTNGTDGQDGYTPVRGVDYWTDEDITGIENHCDDYADEIIADLEEQVEDLQKNQLIEPASGTSINLSNSADSRVKSIELFGRSEQYTTTGAQLFNKNTVTVNKRLSTSAGNMYNENGYNVSNFIEVEPNTQYTLFTNVKSYIAEYSIAKGFIKGYEEWNSASEPLTTIITSENTHFIKFDYRNTDTTVQFQKGNISLPYEEFTGGQASPSANWSQEIKSTGDNGYIIEKFVNKNVFGFNKSFETSMNGLRIKCTDNENISFKGTATSNYLNTIELTLNSPLKANIEYYASAISNIQSPTRFKIWGYDKNHTLIVNQILNGKFTPSKDVVSITLVIENMTVGTTYDIEGKFQIEDGSVKTDYESHQEQVYTIPCQQSMRSIGDVKDTFVKINGNWIERHYISRILSYNGEEITTAYMSTTGELSTGATVDYVLETPLDLPCTQTQTTALEAIQRARTYKNITYIYSEDEIPAEMDLTYYKDTETIINDLITRLEALESEV